MVVGRRALRAAAFVSFAALVALVVGFGAAGDAPTRWILLPPLASAIAVLTTAAVAVDYFGLRRRRHGWNGIPVEPREREALSLRARALELRFRSFKKAGDPRTPAVARALLLALAESDRLVAAGPVVDFLAADATFTRVGADDVADAVRAMALAELGRAESARELAAQLAARRRPSATAAYAMAHVGALCEPVGQAVAAIDDVLETRRGRRFGRELRELRARALARAGRRDEAVATLRDLAAVGERRAVELLGVRAAERSDAALAQAARAALGQASPYR